MRIASIILSLLIAAGVLWASYPTYETVILGDGPKGYWRLDETSGNFLDQLNGAHTCVPAGGVSYSQPGALLDGSANTAAAFNGSTGDCTSNFPTTAGVPEWPDGSADIGWSIELWYKPAAIPTPGTNAPIVGSNMASGYGWQLYSNINGKVDLEVYGQGTGLGACENGIHAAVESSASALTIGNYSHIVVTTIGKGAYTSDNGDPCSLGIKAMKLYINGHEDTAATAFNYSDHEHCECVGNVLGHQQFMVLAHNEFTGFFTTGTIDEISFWGYALSAEQVLCHYDAGIGTPCGNQLDWPFTAFRENKYGSKDTSS